MCASSKRRFRVFRIAGLSSRQPNSRRTRLKSSTGDDPMSLLTHMGRVWNRISSAFERTDIGVAGTSYDDTRSDEDRIRPTATRYAPIREAVERRVNTFLRQEIVSHLEIGCNEIFLLHYIEIAADSQGTDALAQFLHEFSPESRVQWVKKLLGPAVGQYVSVEQFLGLDKEFSAEALAETDPFEERLNQAATPLYRVIFHGCWESRPITADREDGLSPLFKPPHPPPSSGPIPAAPPQTLRFAGPCVRLSVQDAKSPSLSKGGGTRAVEIDHFPAVLGSSTHADVEISGYYV